MRAQLCDILPPTAKCHLAAVAAWADAVRRYYPETGPMHYVNRECVESGRPSAAPVKGAWSSMTPRTSTTVLTLEAKLDHPSDHCTYGENGWYNEDVNVLTAIMNKTQGLQDGEG